MNEEIKISSYIYPIESLEIDLGNNPVHLELLQLGASRPNVSEENWRARELTKSDGLILEVDVHSACQCVRDDEWRRGEVWGSRRRVDSAFEVAITTEHSNCDQIILKHIKTLFNFLNYLLTS